MADVPRLVLLPAFAARRNGDRLILTRKFISGVCEYQKYWPGTVQVLIEAEDGHDDNLDHVSVRPEELPFELSIVRYDDPGIEQSLRGAAVALLAVHYRQLHLAEICARLGVPAVYGAEYSLKTRLQIIRSHVRNPLLRARRSLWEWNQERRIRRAIAMASGVQCNGTPTFDAYSVINRHAMLYFDTRVDASMLADLEALGRRFEERRAARRLRLAFSGRLIAMKGADHLVRVAEGLRRRGKPFELAICGAGDLEPSMRRDVAARGLGDQVRFMGNLDFVRELVPFVRDQVDVFVCCHRQGDPSCTYLETMACGVPIAGYANEAFAGVVQRSYSGWQVPMDRPEALADCLARLNDAEIERHSAQSLAFAREHTFEREFRHRVDHLVGLTAARSNRAA